MPSTGRLEVARAYLASRHVMTVATVGDAGPAAAAVFYAISGRDLVFLSSPTTLHTVNLTRRPQVAITIQDQEADWRQIRGLQIQGVGELLDGADADDARDAFLAKFPGIFGPGVLPAQIVQALAGVRWYRIRVARVRFIDNSLGLGHTDEWSREEMSC
jgi:uncharacterized protein YhbP (UPF0306 family)